MSRIPTLFNQLQLLATEQRNKRTRAIDRMSTAEILRAINREDRTVAAAVGKELPSVAAAVELVVKAFRNGGRLVYVGAGTSGRLGILDASECPPTYGSDPSLVQGVIAGGKRSVFRSREGAEDRSSEGVRAMAALKISRKDVVCGIAASFRTPFVVAALQEAKRRGAKTVVVTTNPRSVIELAGFSGIRRAIDVAICVPVGPEVIMGSTRMKAGTAQKLVLNMITTASMIRCGKVYENLMVDLRMTSRKLKERARRIVMLATGVDYPEADKALKACGGHAKTAIVSILAGVSARDARKRLARSKGFVRTALGKGRPR